jgi:hypothetical protein
MTATLLHMLAAVWQAITRSPQRAWVQFQIWELEHWLADCARDGLLDGAHLRECRGQLAELRIRLIDLEPRSQHAPAPR